MTQEEPIDNIDDLNKGDEILFRDRVHPVTVEDEAERNEYNNYRAVTARGPQGGRILIYQEDALPNSTGGGPLNNLRRVN